MAFDLEQTDELLSTTRAVRRRLDLERDVPDRLIHECIQLAEQAPTGGDIASRRWIVIRDPDTKGRLADLYRAVADAAPDKEASPVDGQDGPLQLAIA